MPSEILNSIDENLIGKELTNEIVVAVKKIYSNNGFVIFACEGNFTVKGNFAGEIAEGGQYMVSGTVGTYGRQIQISARSISEIRNSKTEEFYIAAFLNENFEGIGSKIAIKIASKYGKNVLHELLHDYKKVSQEIPGLSLLRAKECSEKIDEEENVLKIKLELRILGLSKSQILSAIDTFGFTVLDSVNENPYILMRCSGIGFDACERIAQGMSVNLLNELRFEGAIISVLEQLHITTGDTYFNPQQVKNETYDLLGVKDLNDNPILIDATYLEAVSRAIKDKFIVVYHFSDNKCSSCAYDDVDARVSLMVYFKSEVAIKREIESFIQAKKVVPDFDKARTKLLDIAKKQGITPDDNQMKALIMCMYEPFSIITGGPGTGKTTITGILARHFENEGLKCEFCAPTGRAAKRLSEAAGVKANTIHRLLEMSADADNENSEVLFGRNSNNPIDARVIVVDEASMVDTILFKSLLSAIKKNASIILIGDPNQLPSVGAGNILEDLISCKSIPCVSLEYVFRQADESSIASYSCRILRGEELIGNETDFVINNVNSDYEALDLLKNLSNQYRNNDIAILCPTKQNILGTTSLNYELQNLLISDKENGIKVRSDLVLYKDDRVMQSKNNYRIEYFDPAECSIVNGIFNGEIGVVEGSDFLTGECSIVFDGDRHVAYDKKMLSDIELAYAMTVHKAQGCEFDIVIIALGKMNYKLSNRKLLYTAVTRGKKKVIIINSDNRLRKMIASQSSSERNTSLKDFLAIVDGRVNA